MEIHEINISDIKNYRKFNIYYISPTNTLGARVKITEPKRYYKDKTKSIFLSYDYEIGETGQQALNHLIKLGFNPVARCSEFNFYTILCDNWADEFLELKQ
jgi:hypothetical protein|tara:strand:- start:336 stop:638 length:303 start_codon:yes stop_codon:yes gene_type:complete